MKLHYWDSGGENFGDELNPWLWTRIFNNIFDDRDSILFVGIGSLLNRFIPKAAGYHVFGSGIGYGELPVINGSWKFHCVRGPRTARALSLDPALGICDPAILVSRHFSTSGITRSGIAYMPHHYSAKTGGWKTVCECAGFTYVDPAEPIETILTKLASAQLLLSEALHGAIVADSLRTPWIPVRTSPAFLEQKWLDWADSIELRLETHVVPQIHGGYAYLPLAQRTKNATKLALKGLGWSSDSWTPPIPSRSSAVAMEKATTRIVRLCGGGRGPFK